MKKQAIFSSKPGNFEVFEGKSKRYDKSNDINYFNGRRYDPFKSESRRRIVKDLKKTARRIHDNLNPLKGMIDNYQSVLKGLVFSLPEGN